jgi:hypothetical protein
MEGDAALFRSLAAFFILDKLPVILEKRFLTFLFRGRLGMNAGGILYYSPGKYR